MTEKSIDTSLELATTVANVALRGPVPLAKTLAALDVLSDGRVIAGVGPGYRSVTTARSAFCSRSAGSGSTKPSPFCARCCGRTATGDPPPLRLTGLAAGAGPEPTAESRFGSGAGAQPPVFGASRVGALRGAALALRGGRLRARIHLATRRRAAAVRARSDDRVSSRQGVSLDGRKRQRWGQNSRRRHAWVQA